MENLPQHVAIIMDGNGRWASNRNRPRTFGHTKGSERAREIIRECARLGVGTLTLYTFSTENWQRPQREVQFLMRLLHRYMRNEQKEFIDNNLRFQIIGFPEMLPQKIRDEIERLSNITKNNTGMLLNIALSYGSRQEITAAVKRIATMVQAGEVQPEAIDEAMISANLFTHNCPDPDLLIRTGGEFRISNFLLWQAAYCEFFFTEKSWPDFTAEDLRNTFSSFTGRNRRFGKVLTVHEPGA